MATHIAYLLHFSGLQDLDESDYRYWTGENTLSFEGESWDILGKVIELSAFDSEIDNLQDQRFTASIEVSDTAERSRLLADRGPYSVEIGMITSTDETTWTRIPFRFKGRVSNPRWSSGIFSIDVESYTETTDKGRPIYWTNASHTARHPGDTFFEFVEEVARGIPNLDWPPRQGD